MRLATRFSLRFRSFFQRSRVEEDLDDELQFHVQSQIAEHIAAGLSPEDARIAALRAIAGLELVKDKCRDTRGTRGMENMLQDFRFAFRTMRRTPGFTCLAIAALGLCIGANTAIFTIVNTVLFRPLDFPQQEQLIYAGEGMPKMGYPELSFACPDYLFVASHNRSFQSTAVYNTGLYELSGIDRPERVYVARVTASSMWGLKTRPGSSNRLLPYVRNVLGV